MPFISSNKAVHVARPAKANWWLEWQSLAVGITDGKNGSV